MTDAAPADWPKTGATIGPAAFGPFAAAQLSYYALASGDDNPLHLDAAAAAAVGLEAPPIHGMLMMSCFEPALRRWRGDIVIVSLAGKFLRPISVGAAVSITGRVARSSLAPHPELLLRLKALGPNGELAILAEATVRAAGAGAAS
jgi:acyl dehydratase